MLDYSLLASLGLGFLEQLGRMSCPVSVMCWPELCGPRWILYKGNDILYVRRRMEMTSTREHRPLDAGNGHDDNDDEAKNSGAGLWRNPTGVWRR